MQTIFCIALGGHGRVPVSTKNHKLKLIINYNLLATCENDIDECMQNMFEAYMGNLHANVSAVLVSATKDIKLKDYELYVRDDIRRMIYSKLYLEGMAFCKMRYNEIDGPRLQNFWSTYRDYVTKELKSFHIHSICKERMDNFMVVHRLSKVLRKCGQYQDLILLSEGETKAYTYCDRELYNDYARTYGDPLFETSADTGRILGKRFDYTLVLDGDTTVPEGTVIKLLDVAAGNPDRGIIQPGIEVDLYIIRLKEYRSVLVECLKFIGGKMCGGCGSKIHVDNPRNTQNGVENQDNPPEGRKTEKYPNLSVTEEAFTSIYKGEDSSEHSNTKQSEVKTENDQNVCNTRFIYVVEVDPRNSVM
ncbi:uncharacterized protein [Mytilus edulis]|uniref:uncharacterized protein n=1 Tax=Mytilus edulis TaxID=6550 RepID=UPI0039EEEB02